MTTAYLSAGNDIASGESMEASAGMAWARAWEHGTRVGETSTEEGMIGKGGWDGVSVKSSGRDG